MWRKVRPIIFLLALASCLCWPSHGGCSESRMYQISESELQTLETHLDALEANNETLMLLLSESDEGLTIAAEELTRLRRELSEAKKRLEESQTSLMQMQRDAEDARSSLARANADLQSARESFKQSERERDRIEGRLRTQRNIWEVLCLVAVGIAAGK